MNIKNLLLIVTVFASMTFAKAQNLDPNEFVSYLKFDDNLNDASNTYGTTVTWRLTKGADVTYVSGAQANTGNAGYFNSTSIISTGLGWNPNAGFTMLTWINLDNLSSVLSAAQTIAHQRDSLAISTNNGRVMLESLKSGDYFSSFTDGKRLSSTTAATTGTWYHIASVKQVTTSPASDRLYYVNGASEGSNNFTSPNEDCLGELVIGSQKGGGAPLKGAALDEFLLTTQILDQPTIQYIYENGIENAIIYTQIRKNVENSFSSYYSNGNINVYFSKDVMNASYKIYSVSGACIEKGFLTSAGNVGTIKASLNKGAYILQIESQSGKFSNKFFVK